MDDKFSRALQQQFLVMFQEKLAGNFSALVQAYEKHCKLAMEDGERPSDFSVSFKFKIHDNCSGNAARLFAPEVSWKVASSYKDDDVWFADIDPSQQMLPGMDAAERLSWHPVDEYPSSVLGMQWKALLEAAKVNNLTVLFSIDVGAGIVHRWDGHWTSFRSENVSDIIDAADDYSTFIALAMMNDSLSLTIHSIKLLKGLGYSIQEKSSDDDVNKQILEDEENIFADGYGPQK